MPIQSYKELIVWQKSISLCEKVYKLTEDFPKSEIYGLTSQIRRAVVSIPSNIAEGRYRGTRKDFVQFLRIAYGSTAELETQLEIARLLKYINESNNREIGILITEISKILLVMIKKLSANSYKQ